MFLEIRIEQQKRLQKLQLLKHMHQETKYKHHSNTRLNKIYLGSPVKGGPFFLGIYPILNFKHEL
jgi:hypothetical protein